MADKHGWYSWENYQDIYTRRMADFAFMIVENRIVFSMARSVVLWSGFVRLRNGIRVEIAETQELSDRDGRLFVHAASYKYHAYVESTGRNLLRYDNVHVHPGHPDEHHKHVYDMAEGHPLFALGRLVHVGQDGWPDLFDVLDEVCSEYAQER